MSRFATPQIQWSGQIRFSRVAVTAKLRKLRLVTVTLEWKCWLLLPGASEPRLRSLNRRASSFGLSRYIKQREQPEQSYRLQLEISPTRRNHHGQKTNLYTLVDPVSPPSETVAQQPSLVEAPGTAPGSDKLIALAVYHHSQTDFHRLTPTI